MLVICLTGGNWFDYGTHRAVTAMGNGLLRELSVSERKPRDDWVLPRRMGSLRGLLVYSFVCGSHIH